MIAVIADDFTGAAEIGGIGLRYGLNVVIETEDIQHHNADLLIIATDTRSLPANEAAETIKRITEKLLKLKPQFIYKKIDSALRGNIVRELEAQMEVCGHQRAIVIAANPNFNRLIQNGTYTIDGVPLNQTGFAYDPEFPVHSSRVLEVLNAGTGVQMTNLKATDSFPEKGIIVGDVANMDDLEKWALRLDKCSVFAGASGFFNVLLSSGMVFESKESPIFHIPFGDKALYVFGSTFPKDMDLIHRLEANDYYFSNMPEEIYYNPNPDPKYLKKWVNDIVSGIHKHQRVIALIDYTPSDEPQIAQRIKKTIGSLVQGVLAEVEINELLVEGGGTTSVVLNCLDVKKLIPVQELETGVIRMKIEGDVNFCLTTKPGSYFWPDSVWGMESEKKTAG
jgi:uncharacterized protein YgbK (DUF1537 family)